MCICRYDEHTGVLSGYRWSIIGICHVSRGNRNATISAHLGCAVLSHAILPWLGQLCK